MSEKLKKSELGKFIRDIPDFPKKGIIFKDITTLLKNNSALKKSVDLMVKKYPNIEFQIHTDDIEETQKIFGIHSTAFSDIELNWKSILYAKHLIISNSAFAIIPALLNENVKEVIAPRGWANHNNFDGNWKRPQNFYRKFTYI